MKHEAEPRLAVKIAGVITLLILPFVVLSLLEVFLAFLHTKTGSAYFENEKEVLRRNDIILDAFISNPDLYREELKSPKTKIAIFGGSSATGFAAPFGFGKFVEEAGKGRLIVHNYAEAGAPFVGFQAELLKMVMGHYDVIIIYAGHNEIWAQTYAKSKDANDVILLPWGKRVNSKGAFLKHDLKMIELRNILENDQPPAEKLKNWLLDYAYRASLDSRILHLLKLAISPASRAASSSEPGVTPLHYYAKQAFIDAEGKREMLANFSATIKEISSRLKPTQKLIVSTQIANDLFPPLLDSFDAQDGVLDEVEKEAASLYDASKKQELDLVAKDVSSLPDGAHRNYLESVVCFDGIKPQPASGRLDAKCLDLAQLARGKDAFPARVLPEVNAFIRSLRGAQGNLLVIDPEAVLRSQKDQTNYLSLFVDFQHPSALAHMLIASQILDTLFPDQGVKLSQSDECDKYAVVWGGKQVSIEAPLEKIKDSAQANLHWLEFFISVKQQTAPFLYEYYQTRANDKLKKCLP